LAPSAWASPEQASAPSAPLAVSPLVRRAVVRRADTDPRVPRAARWSDALTLILASPGHGRVLAARQLGMEQIPTICLSGLSETQRRAY
jgi:hypothetical protein